MAKTSKQDPNYDWAKKHIADFERYLEEQCQPYFEEVSVEDSSKFMAPMWWSVGYVILRGKMNLIELIKEKTLWLIGAVLITIPLLVCYPLLRIFGLSEGAASIAMVCLSGVAYILLVTRIEPFLYRALPFIAPKAQHKFSVSKPKAGSIGIYVKKGPLYAGGAEIEFNTSNTYAVREHSGNWTHS